jgi:dTDP-4-amino-4,6-dideoxygalactose transaminase
MNIPQCNPKANYLAHHQEIDDAIKRVLDGGYYILGNEVSAFESEFASFCNASHSVSCANGTDALELILRGMGIGHGDEVITVANTAVATVSAIERSGASVRFVDIEPDSFTMSPESLKTAFGNSDKIKAVIPVHLFGSPADIVSIKKITDEHKICLIEDCAQAHGAEINGRKVGTFGIAGAFSFYPTKNLGALGDGGAIITDSAVLSEKLRSLRQYGWVKRYISECSGINSRLDEMQASILRVKLRYLARDNQRRREIAEFYSKELSFIADTLCSSPLLLPSSRAGYTHVYHQYVIRTPQRDQLKDHLSNLGIGTAVHYRVPIHQQPAYAKMKVKLPVTEKLNDEILSLPMFPELTDQEILIITNAIKASPLTRTNKRH